MQPLFREVLEHYDPNVPEAPNLYAFFRAFWYPPARRGPHRDAAPAPGQRHGDRRPRPPPPARPPRPAPVVPRPLQPPADAAPATTYLGDLEILEQMLHNRLFARPRRRAERLPQGTSLEAMTVKSPCGCVRTPVIESLRLVE